MALCLSPTQWGRCRKCSACKDHRVRSWTLRLLLEAQLYADDQVTFITLTYAPEHLPASQDEAKLQVQKWFRSLRKNLGKKSHIRYVAALEQGTNGTRRFHWHCILFGLRFTAANRSLLQRVWGKGFIDWKRATGGRMAYVLKYVIKGNKFLMSRRPGIGDGMIEHINKMIDCLSRTEKMKIIADQNPTEFIDRCLVNDVTGKALAVTDRVFKINKLRQGGYYFPLHDFLKKRIKPIIVE